MDARERIIAGRVEDQSLSIEAAKRQTAPLLRKGWIGVLIGWALPVIPLIGLAGFPIAFFSGVIAGIVAMARGNVGGGLTLALVACFGSPLMAMLWVFLYLLFGISLPLLAPLVDPSLR